MRRLIALLSVLTLLWAFSIELGAMDAQRIAEIKQGSNQSLWQFFGQFPASFEAQVFYGLFISGLIGMLASWAWKYSQGMTADNHWTRKYLLGQILWLAGSSIAAIMTVGFTTDNGEFFGWLSVLWTGGFAGFSGEVKVKKDGN